MEKKGCTQADMSVNSRRGGQEDSLNERMTYLRGGEGSSIGNVRQRLQREKNGGGDGERKGCALNTPV